MKAWFIQYRTALLVLLTLIGWSAIFVVVSPEALIEQVGVANAYLISFLISLVAGFSIFTGTAAYATVIEFARAGVNPLYLGVISGVGLFLSDSIFYLLVMRGRDALTTRFGHVLSRLHSFMERMPRAVVYLGVYLFCAFGPIPNDVMMSFLIIGGYKYKRVWLVFLAGDVTFMLFLSYLFQQ